MNGPGMVGNDFLEKLLGNCWGLLTKKQSLDDTCNGIHEWISLFTHQLNQTNP